MNGTFGMKAKKPNEQAMSFIATYDKPDAGEYEKHIVRIARTWRSLIRSRHSVQGIVNRVVDELQHSKGADYGSGWDELKEKFTAWAVAHEWLDQEKARKLLSG